jgi:hypothetical protein
LSHDTDAGGWRAKNIISDQLAVVGRRWIVPHSLEPKNISKADSQLPTQTCLCFRKNVRAHGITGSLFPTGLAVFATVITQEKNSINNNQQYKYTAYLIQLVTIVVPFRYLVP